MSIRPEFWLVMVFLSKLLQKSFVTTPIFYTNAAPHIGHLYSAVLADASHRWEQISSGDPRGCVFSTGTDEHGLKIRQAADNSGCTPQQLCDNISKKFKELFDKGSINYTHFIRTTDANHISLVQNIWTDLLSKGWIYKGSYSGWYSVQDEAFLTDLQVIDGVEPGTKVSIESGHKVEWSSEENYKFKLSAFQESLINWMDSEPYPVMPEFIRHSLHKELVNNTLEDLSVSRPTSRIQWGIPVPNDPSHTIYVWLDALTNYLTVSGYPSSDHIWPATSHIIGKDIARFHCVYWPAFLLALELPLPHQVVCHGHWTVDSTKMSKSKGNVIDPFEELEQFSSDGLRYYLLINSTLQTDGDYVRERAKVVINSDLADNLGNLFSRVTAPKLNPPGLTVQFHRELFPLDVQNNESRRAVERDYDLLNSLYQLPSTVTQHYSVCEFSHAITAIMEVLHMTNSFVQRAEPWNLVKNVSDHQWLETVLATSIESLRLCACLLHPIIPRATTELLGYIGTNSNGVIEPEDLVCWITELDVHKCTRTNITNAGGKLFNKIL